MIEHLQALEKDSNARIIGINDIENEAQAKVGGALVQLYGNHREAIIYFEPFTRNQGSRPADIVLVHPEIGVLVVEVKGWSIDYIDRIEGSNFHVKGNKYAKPLNPLKQAQNVMFDIKNAIAQVGDNIHDVPIVDYLIALPNITDESWHNYGYQNTIDMSRLVFAEHFADFRVLRERIEDNVSAAKDKTNRKDAATTKEILITRAAFGASAVLMSEEPEIRDIPEESLGERLDEQRREYKRLSEEQEILSRLPVQGFPRQIRGVAGSGKTIVLASMVARYIKRYRGSSAPRIAILCYNRTLVDMLRRKVQAAYKEQTDSELPAEFSASVRTFNGLLYQLGQEGKWQYVPIKVDASKRAEQYLHQWFGNNNEPIFDAIFVDEAQDLLDKDIQLLSAMVKFSPQTGEKNLIIFYDDAQNLYGHKRPNWKELGINVQSGDRSRVMRQCHRNTKEIVGLALNLLLAKQSELKAATREFADVNYLKSNNLIKECPNKIDVYFAQRSFNEPEVHRFGDAASEMSWLVEQVRSLIMDEYVRPQDILLISRFGYERLPEYQILADLFRQSIPKEYLEGISSPQIREEKDKPVFRPKHITISTPHSVKGYDADIVFIFGLEKFMVASENPKYPSERERAIFYVAATRAKSLLFLSGVQTPTPSLLDEAQKYLESEC